jgi:hypothetical protein
MTNQAAAPAQPLPLLQRATLQTQANRYAYLQRQNAVKLVQKIVNS